MTTDLQSANNLSDLASAATARTNLGIDAPTFTGTATAPVFAASGLPGATAASRYVGATTSGAPLSGTFAVGDYIIDQTGTVWICYTAGTPGTWLPGGSGVELASAELSSDSATFGSGAGTDIAGLSITFVAPARAVVIDLTVPTIVFSVAGNVANLILADSSNTVVSQAYVPNPSSANVATSMCRARLPRSGANGSYTLVAGNSYTFKARGSMGQGSGGSTGTGFLYTATGTVRPILRAVTC